MPEIEFDTWFADGDVDWRGQLAEIGQQHRFFRIAGESTIWVTRYDDMREIMHDWQLFSPNDSAGRGAGNSRDDGTKSADIYLLPPNEEGARLLDIRHGLMPMFSPAEARRWAPRMHEVARDLVSGFVGQGEVDAVSAFARRYFPYIGAEWIGAPREDWDWLTDLEGRAFVAPSNPQSRMLDLQNDAMMAIIDYCKHLVALKRKSPDNSLTSFALTLELEGRPITDAEAAAIVAEACLGSGHTVAAQIGYVLKYLSQHEALRRRVAHGSAEELDRIFEELLRMFALWGHERWVTRDTEFHGLSLKKDVLLFLAWPLGNFDRSPNRHLTFGTGPHQCLGRHWARVSGTVAIAEWHRQIPEYELEPGTSVVEQIYAGVGYHALPLRWAVDPSTAS